MGRARARTSHDREVVDGAKVGRFAANVLPVGRTLVRIGWLLLALAGGTRAAAAGLAASEVEFARLPAGLDRAVAEQAWLEGEGARLEAGGALPVRRAGAERGMIALNQMVGGKTRKNSMVPLLATGHCSLVISRSGRTLRRIH